MPCCHACDGDIDGTSNDNIDDGGRDDNDDDDDDDDGDDDYNDDADGDDNDGDDDDDGNDIDGGGDKNDDGGNSSPAPHHGRMAARWSAAGGRRHGCKRHGETSPRPSLSLSPSPSLLLVPLLLSPRRPLRCTPGGASLWQRPKAPREAEAPERTLTLGRAGPCSRVAAWCDLIADIAGAGLAPVAATGQSSLAENAMGNGQAASCCNATRARAAAD